MRFWLALLYLREIKPRQGSALEQRKVERQRRNGAGGEPDHQMPAAPGDRAERLQRDLAADGIVDHIRPVSAGQRLERVAPVSLGVVDGFIRAVLSREGAFL